jgi:hypothetical protein
MSPKFKLTLNEASQDTEVKDQVQMCQGFWLTVTMRLYTGVMLSL